MSHVKRHTVPKTWTLQRKETKFVTRNNPGPHDKETSMPLAIWLKELGEVSTTKEAKRALPFIKVDERKVKDFHFPVGFQDLLTVGKTKYRITLQKGKLHAEKANGKEKTCRIQNKTSYKGKTQLNLSDGRNILVDKDMYKVGDSVVISLPDQKIVKHVKLEKGAKIMLTGGKHLGVEGILQNIENDQIKVKTKDTEEKTLKKFAYALP